MHRKPILELIASYRRSNPSESACAQRIESLVRAHPDCFDRTCLPGHVTASTWIASADGQRFLLTHHRKLDRWLQLGGHADGDPDVLRVALREAREESGMKRFEIQRGPDGQACIDLDVHGIPARRGEPAHEHHDIRFVLVAEAGQSLEVSDESHDLRWFDIDELEAIAADESVLRLGRKARGWLRV